MTVLYYTSIHCTALHSTELLCIMHTLFYCTPKYDVQRGLLVKERVEEGRNPNLHKSLFIGNGRKQNGYSGVWWAQPVWTCRLNHPLDMLFSLWYEVCWRDSACKWARMLCPLKGCSNLCMAPVPGGAPGGITPFRRTASIGAPLGHNGSSLPLTHGTPGYSWTHGDLPSTGANLMMQWL